MAFLTVPEASRRLRMAQRTLRRDIVSGELPAAHVGGRYLVDEADLAAFVRARRVRPGARAGAAAAAA